MATSNNKPTLDEHVLQYVEDGGKLPATYQRGYLEAGRFGLEGVGSGIPKDAQPDYQKGVEQAQADRAKWVNLPEDPVVDPTPES